MEFIIRPRGWGKSVKCIRQSAELGIPIVVATEIRKKAIIDKAASMGIEIPPVYSVMDMKNNYPTFERPDKAIVDDAETIVEWALCEYLRCTAVSATLTEGEET